MRLDSCQIDFMWNRPGSECQCQMGCSTNTDCQIECQLSCQNARVYVRCQKTCQTMCQIQSGSLESNRCFLVQMPSQLPPVAVISRISMDQGWHLIAGMGASGGEICHQKMVLPRFEHMELANLSFPNYNSNFLGYASLSNFQTATEIV